ncbi:MAG TPA: FHA domain-containing protein, partial [Nitrospiraceae bacterium]|nr:FHA domain-containing protein [Nitrospiraceae bacterium]
MIVILSGTRNGPSGFAERRLGFRSSSFPEPDSVTCIAGPDCGKRFAILTQPLLLGQSSQCDVFSDDPEVAERHARFWADGLHARCQPVETGVVFVDGHRIQEALLLPQQQIRIGRSVWRCGDGRAQTGTRFDGWLDDLSGRISSVAG